MENLNSRPLMTPSDSQSRVASRFMSRVYAWMTLGVGITAFVSGMIGQNTQLAVSVVSNRPVFYGIMIVEFITVISMTALINRINSLMALGLYLFYAALNGITFSVIFVIYTQESIFSTFGLTAFSFAGLSAFGAITKRDLGPVGSFCMMGLFGMIGFAILSIFFPSMMGGVSGQVYSLVGVVVFAGLTAYDTQKIKALADQGMDGSDAGRKGAIYGALTLYLDFINLFISLLRLTGNRRN